MIYNKINVRNYFNQTNFNLLVTDRDKTCSNSHNKNLTIQKLVKENKVMAANSNFED